MSLEYRKLLRELCRTEVPDPYGPTKARKSALNTVLANGFHYSRKLHGHASCVNALAFSNCRSRWLASAGDDPFVLLWDFHRDDVTEPSFIFTGPKANVFALAFSATDHYLYSGDTDNKIHQYDLSYLPSSGSSGFTPAVAAYDHHEDSVRAISCHPEQDHEFLSAGEDGRIILHDVRTPSRRARAQNVLQHNIDFTSVQYHPNMPHIFVTSDIRGEICLRDSRMAFGPSSQRSNKGIVHTYVTRLSKGTKFGRPEVSSVTFDHTGLLSHAR